MKRGICAMCNKKSMLYTNRYCKKCSTKRMRAYRKSEAYECTACGCKKVKKIRDMKVFQSMIQP